MTSRVWRRLIAALVTALIGIATLATPLAQVPGTMGAPDMTGIILDGIQKAGALAACVLFFMWFEMRARWREEREARIALEKERTGLLERVLTALHNTGDAIQEASNTAVRAIAVSESLANLVKDRLMK